MSWFEKYTAYQPMATTTATTSWGGWRIMDQRCYKCAHCAFVSGIPVCHCVSRTVKHGVYGDECVSYREVGA